MEDALITILESFKHPVYRQGSMEKEAVYPETLITFWNTTSPDHANYDNSNYGTEWTFDVYVYSTNPSTPYTLIDSIRTALKEAGWTVPSRGYDVSSDEPTHMGRAIECIYLDV